MAALLIEGMIFSEKERGTPFLRKNILGFCNP
jgi:hypothetical protein